MLERGITAFHHQHRIQNIAPRSVAVKIDLDPVGIGPEGLPQERRRADAIFSLPTLRRQNQFGRIRLCVAGGDCNLPTWDRHGLQNETGGWFPQPIADLVMEGDVLFLGVDVDMIAQSVEQLRSVRLRIDRLQLNALIIFPPLRTVGLRVEIDTTLPTPDAGETAQWPQIGKRVGANLVRLRKVGFRYIHDALPRS